MGIASFNRNGSSAFFSDNNSSKSRSLLPASSRHAHTWHRPTPGPMTIYLFNIKTFVFLCLSLILFIDKGGVGFL
jgi:hypothetical protein